MFSFRTPESLSVEATLSVGSGSSFYPVSREPCMLRRIGSNFSRPLPVVREHHKITASLLRLEDYIARVETYLRPSQTIRLLDFHLRDHPNYGGPLRLLCYQSQACSQNGEDGIIHEIFRRIGTTTKVFAEVGVGNGCENNTAQPVRWFR